MNQGRNIEGEAFAHLPFLSVPTKIIIKTVTEAGRRHEIAGLSFAFKNKGSKQMASFHFEVKSGRKGVAADHSMYIARQGFHRRRNDLVTSGFGKLPSWADNDPAMLWRASDKYERANGSAYREMIIALPSELTREQLQQLVDHLISELAGTKPYQYAVHSSESSIEGEMNTHMHLMISDRVPDGIDRPADKMFRRYNAQNPANGGCRKDSGGRNRMQVRDELIAKRKRVADIQNAHLTMRGYSARVDHRTLKAQGVQRKPERHLGPAKIKHMSEGERAEYVAARGNVGRRLA